MLIMNNICNHLNCAEQACWLCSCRKTQKFCDKHNKIHSLETNCLSKCFDYQIMKKKIKAYTNAIEKAIQEYLKLSAILVKELQKNIKKNLIMFNNMKTILKEYLLYEKNEPAEKIIAWAKGLMFLKRDKSLFTSKTQILLDLKIISLEEFPEIEKLKPWVCHSCKSLNPSSKIKCSVCNINKLVKNINEPNNYAGTHEEVQKSNVWKCKCGLYNLELNDICTKCQNLKPGLEGWICKDCTTVNSNMQTKCESCYSAKDASTKGQEDPWECNLCYCYNLGSRNNCSKCNSIKPKQEIAIAKQPEPKKIENNFEWICLNCNNSNYNYFINYAFCRASKGEQPVEEDKNDEWTCENCKTKNKMASRFCNKCFENKSSVKEQPIVQNVGWKCFKCSTSNSVVSVKCSWCLSVKPLVNDNWTCPCCSEANPNTTTTCKNCSYIKNVAIVKVPDQKTVQQTKTPSIICSMCKNPTTIVTCPGCMKATNLANACVYCGKSLVSVNLCSNCKPKIQVSPKNTNIKKKCKFCGYNNKYTGQRCYICKRAL